MILDKIPLMTTKLRLVFTITMLFLSFYASAQSNCWKQEVSQSKISKNFSNRFDVKKGQHFIFNEKLFKKELQEISFLKKNSKIVYFPDNKGNSVAFKVFEAPVLSPELSKKYPNIKSYAGRSVGDEKAIIRFSVSHKGIQSMMVRSNQEGTTFMQKDSGANYVLYTRNPNAVKDANIVCTTTAVLENNPETLASKSVNNQELRKFRLAVSASGEYTQHHGGTVVDALAAINATVTRINEIFETDLAVTFELVANLDQVIYIDSEIDPYGSSLSTQVQNTLDNTLGSANYDVGILFNKSQESDGNAGFIGSVCVNNKKGSAYVSGEVPEGDLFDIDFVSHEIGHQFGANHTWSFESEGTQAQVEPGSGTTIMGYAGITGADNVALMGDDYFHYVSIDQITSFLETISCGETIDLTNTPPIVTPVGDFIIPKATAFMLVGAATDADIDNVLTFTWEQIDNGVVTNTTFGPTNLIGANFRSQKPTTDPQRYFPKLSSVISGNLSQTMPDINSTWETISTVEREMNFAFTVRDNAIGGGQVVSDLVSVYVENSSGPFAFTSHDTNVVLTAGNKETITWDVANTNIAPINVLSVDIFLSTDGGQTFPIILAEDVANDGSYDVVIPANITTEARLMIKANGNIFFAVNSANLQIEESEIVLYISELEQNVCQGDMLVVPFNYEAYEGFNEEATFSIIAPPPGIAIDIFPETAISSDTPVDITFTNTDSIAVGSYSIRLLATTGSLTKEIAFNLNINEIGLAEVVLLAPINEILDISTSILLEWEANVLATSYGVEVATDINFTNIVESGSAIGSSYSVLNLDNETQYYWRVNPRNSCGQVISATANTFTTIHLSCDTKVGIGLPLTISTANTVIVSSQVTILNDLPIADINVNLKVDHSYLSDLTITLTSPAGTSVVLMSNICEEFVNINATFDDEGEALVCSGMPAVSGVVMPQGNLGVFKGESSLGVWILTVTDNAPADGGTFKSFSLDICAEGEFRPDADKDGVFDDGPDLCLGTPEGTMVDATGCPVLIFEENNFRVEVNSEACRESDDGSIVVTVNEALDYSIVISGNGVSITDSFATTSYTLSDLSAGTYSVCLSATVGNTAYREQCFEVVLTEPELLSVTSKVSLNGSLVELELQGASLYNIELNGVVQQTTDSQITLKLSKGTNSLKVTTNLPCQGLFEEQFFYTSDIVVSPNPVTNIAKVFFGVHVERIDVSIFSATGRFIKSKDYLVNGVSLDIDLSALATGLYFVKFNSETVQGTSKVIKK